MSSSALRALVATNHAAIDGYTADWIEGPLREAAQPHEASWWFDTIRRYNQALHEYDVLVLGGGAYRFQRSFGLTWNQVKDNIHARRVLLVVSKLLSTLIARMKQPEPRRHRNMNGEGLLHASFTLPAPPEAIEIDDEEVPAAAPAAAQAASSSAAAAAASSSSAAAWSWAVPPPMLQYIRVELERSGRDNAWIERVFAHAYATVVQSTTVWREKWRAIELKRLMYFQGAGLNPMSDFAHVVKFTSPRVVLFPEETSMKVARFTYSVMEALLDEMDGSAPQKGDEDAIVNIYKAIIKPMKGQGRPPPASAAAAASLAPDEPTRKQSRTRQTEEEKKIAKKESAAKYREKQRAKLRAAKEEADWDAAAAAAAGPKRKIPGASSSENKRQRAGERELEELVDPAPSQSGFGLGAVMGDAHSCEAEVEGFERAALFGSQDSNEDEVVVRNAPFLAETAAAVAATSSLVLDMLLNASAVVEVNRTWDDDALVPVIDLNAGLSQTEMETSLMLSQMPNGGCLDCGEPVKKPGYFYCIAHNCEIDGCKNQMTDVLQGTCYKHVRLDPATGSQREGVGASARYGERKCASCDGELYAIEAGPQCVVCTHLN